MKMLCVMMTALVIAVSGVRADDELKIDWTTNYDVAVRRMEKTKKPVLVVFTDPVACPPCKRMDKETWTDKRVVERLKGFVCCKLVTTMNPRTGEVINPHTQEILDRFQQYGQPVRGWPTVRFFKAGKPVLILEAGFTSPDDLLTQMKKVEEGK